MNINNVVLNINKICRLCLQEHDVMSSIFDKFDSYPSFSDKIRICASIKVTLGDGLPTLICQQCINNINNWFDFKQQCRHSNYTLHQYLEKEQAAKQEVEQILAIKIKTEKSKTHGRCHSKKTADKYMASSIYDMKNRLDNLLNVEVIITEHDSEIDPSKLNMINEADTSSLTQDTCDVEMLNEQPEEFFTHADTTDAHFIDEIPMKQQFSDDDDSSQHIQIIKSEPLEEPFSQTDTSSYTQNIKTDKEDLQMCIEPLENVSTHTGPSHMQQEVTRYTDGPSKECYILPGRISVAQNDEVGTSGLLDCNKDDILLNETTVKPELGDAVIGQDLNSKKKYVNAKEKYTCSVCKKSFVNYTIFRNHEYQHTKFTCRECGEVCNFRKAFNIHSKLHDVQQQYSCNECGKVFSNKIRFNVHLKIHCKEMPYLCNFCGKSFRSKHLLKHHLQGHSVETPFLCNVCGKSYKTNISLRRHVKGHFAEKKYVCLVCRKSFLYSYGLKKHSVVHISDRPLSCTVCNKTFKRKKALAGHIRTHTGEKPYVCTYCNRSFSFEWNLIQHLRLHTGTKPYVCPVCQEAFTHNITLRNHIKQHET